MARKTGSRFAEPYAWRSLYRFFEKRLFVERGFFGRLPDSYRIRQLSIDRTQESDDIVAADLDPDSIGGLFHSLLFADREDRSPDEILRARSISTLSKRSSSIDDAFHRYGIGSRIRAAMALFRSHPPLIANHRRKPILFSTPSAFGCQKSRSSRSFEDRRIALPRRSKSESFIVCRYRKAFVFAGDRRAIGCSSIGIFCPIRASTRQVLSRW